MSLFITVLLLPVTKKRQMFLTLTVLHCNFCKSQEQISIIVFIAVYIYKLLTNNKLKHEHKEDYALGSNYTKNIMQGAQQS